MRNASAPPGRGVRERRLPADALLLQAGEQLPWGTAESIPETAWVEFWIEIPPGVTKQQLKAE